MVYLKFFSNCDFVCLVPSTRAERANSVVVWEASHSRDSIWNRSISQQVVRHLPQHGTSQTTTTRLLPERIQTSGLRQVPYLFKFNFTSAWLNDTIFSRYTIVLQIFRLRAQTREARLQVALAEIPFYRWQLDHILFLYMLRCVIKCISFQWQVSGSRNFKRRTQSSNWFSKCVFESE